MRGAGCVAELSWALMPAENETSNVPRAAAGRKRKERLLSCFMAACYDSRVGGKFPGEWQTRNPVNLEKFRKQLAGDDIYRQRAFHDFFEQPGIGQAYKEAKGEPRVE